MELRFLLTGNCVVEREEREGDWGVTRELWEVWGRSQRRGRRNRGRRGNTGEESGEPGKPGDQSMSTLQESTCRAYPFWVNGWDNKRKMCQGSALDNNSESTKHPFMRTMTSGVAFQSLICWLNLSRGVVRAGACYYCCWLPLWEFWAGENMRVPLNHYTESIIDLNDFQTISPTLCNNVALLNVYI